MKKISIIILLILASSSLVHATPALSGFSVISTYLQSGKIKVYDGSLGSEFIATIAGSRGSNGPNYELVTMEVVFYIQDVYGVQQVLKTISITSSDFNGMYLKYNESPGSPAAADNHVKVKILEEQQNGFVGVKYRYKDGDTWQSYVNVSGSFQTINVSPLPVQSSIYLIAGSSNSEYYLSTTASVPFGWGSQGTMYYAFTTYSRRQGTVPIYEFKGKAYDQYGNPAYPANVTYYSMSDQLPTAALTGGGTWQIASRRIAFYAYPTQVSGTVPVHCYSNDWASLYLFIGTGEVSGNYSQQHVAFYAYPYTF